MLQDGQKKGHVFQENHQHCHYQLSTIHSTSRCAKILHAISHVILTLAL